MFDIGFWELLIIGIVLLLVMGPERLPEVARQAAFLVRKARQGMYRLRNEMQGEMDGTPFADLQAARREMSDFKNDIRQFGHELADSVEERKRSADGTPSPVVVPAPVQASEASTSASTQSTPKKVPAAKSSSTSKKASKKKATKKITKKTTKKVTARKKTSAKTASQNTTKTT